MTRVRCQPWENSQDPRTSCPCPTSMATGSSQTRLCEAHSPSLAFSFSPQPHPDMLSNTPLTPPTMESEVPPRLRISVHTNLKMNNRARGGVFGARGCLHVHAATY